MAKKKQTAEDLVAGLRRSRGHLPTKLSEKEYEKKMKRKAMKGAKFE